MIMPSWSWRDILRMLRPTDQAPSDTRLVRIGDPEHRLRECAQALGVSVFDFRGMPRNTHYPARKWGWFRDDVAGKNIPSRGRAHGRLPWEKRTAIMLHRTGVRMTAPRFLGCPCHAAIAHDGSIVLCHPPDAYVWAGHAANRFATSVEISSADGSIAGIQTKAARLLVRYLVEERQRHCQARMAIMAHRQSHKSRGNDPGPEIWWKVAVPLVAELGLVQGPVVGTGRPIPDSWWWAPENRGAA